MNHTVRNNSASKPKSRFHVSSFVSYASSFVPILLTSLFALPARAELGADWIEATSAASWEGRMHHTSVVHDGKIWVFGAYTGPNSYLNDVWYSTDGEWWNLAINEAPWQARGGHTSVVYDGKMWILGGTYGYMNDVWYSADGVNWIEATSSASWVPRGHHTSVVHDGKMWVIGGKVGSNYGNDVWYSTDGVTWTQATAAAQWSARGYHTSMVSDNKIWILGGNDSSSGRKNDVWYSSDGVTWTQATAAAQWPARLWHRCVEFDTKMWVLGGGTASGFANDVWYSMADGEGEGDECYYQTLFEYEWPLLAVDWNLDDDGVNAAGHTIPERWGLSMVHTVLCNTRHPHHDGTLAAYETNLAALESTIPGGCEEDPLVLARIEPYRHAVAGLLLINQSRQDYFKDLFGLECDYAVYRRGGKTPDEPFSDDGDLDGDGVANADEYDNVVSWGGSLDHFVEAVTETWWSGGGIGRGQMG